MKIVPFEKYSFFSGLTTKDLQLSIDESCEPCSILWPFCHSKKPLFGQRNGNKFKVYRAIRYQNSFLPIAFGEILKNEAGSKVEVSLRMNLFVIVFMIVWLSGALLAAIISFDKEPISSMVPIGMLVFGYVLVQAGFWSEVPKLKKLIYNATKTKS